MTAHLASEEIYGDEDTITPRDLSPSLEASPAKELLLLWPFSQVTSNTSIKFARKSEHGKRLCVPGQTGAKAFEHTKPVAQTCCFPAVLAAECSRQISAENVHGHATAVPPPGHLHHSFVTACTAGTRPFKPALHQEQVTWQAAKQVHAHQHMPDCPCGCTCMAEAPSWGEADVTRQCCSRRPAGGHVE